MTFDWERKRSGETSSGSDPSPSPEVMAVPAPAKVARALAASAAALVLLWCVHFRGGLAFSSPTNKGLIFNVRHPSASSLQVLSFPVAVDVASILVNLPDL